MDSGRGGGSAVCARDATEVVREVLGWLREGAAREKFAAAASEVGELRRRLERLRQEHPGVVGVDFSDDMRLLLQRTGEGRVAVGG